MRRDDGVPTRNDSERIACGTAPLVDTVLARSSIRHLRGHTNAQLVMAHDGHAYVTKYFNNPIGPRAVIAEYVGTQLLRLVGLPGPTIALVSCVKACPGVPEGLHVGSQYPGDPLSTSVFDFLPTQLLERVSPWRRVVAGIIAFDIWSGNVEMRQNIFTRGIGNWQAQFIDNTHLFGGPEWKFATTAATGTLISQPVLKAGLLLVDFGDWIHRFQGCTEALDGIRHSVPDEWLTPQDKDALDNAFAKLRQRASNLFEVIETHIRDHAVSGLEIAMAKEERPVPSCAPERRFA